MNYKILIVALSLSGASAAFVPASSATDDPYWYCDGNAANDPNAPGNPGNHAPWLAERTYHTFAPIIVPSMRQDSAMRGDGVVAVAYSLDDARNGACAPSEVALTDGDGELESGFNGAIFSVSDATNCGGYGNGHHGSVHDAGARNWIIGTYLSFTTGTDGPIHAVDDPTTTGVDERTVVADPCLGNGIVANDPATDGYDCTSNTGWSINRWIVVWATPTPVDAVLSGGVCDSVHDVQPLFLDTGVTIIGGPAVQGIAHSEYALAYAQGTAGGIHAACANVNGAPFYAATAGSPSNSPHWHSQCAVYLGITTGGMPFVRGISVPLEGDALLS